MRPLAMLVILLFMSLAAGCDDDGDDSRDTFTVTMPAASMEPTIKAGSRVTVTRVDEDFEPQRGEVVLFTNPGGWLSGDDGEGMLLKRIIGIAGDTVTCCDSAGRIEVNGVPVDEPYIAERKTCAGAGVGFGCRWKAGPVPAGTVFVLGDNRGASADSRAHMCPPGVGACAKIPWVDIDLIKGTVEGLQPDLGAEVAGLDPTLTLVAEDDGFAIEEPPVG